MSNVVSALKGATYQGFAHVADMGPGGMITLRGDLSAAKFIKAVKAVTGVAVPDMRGMGQVADKAVCWMSPDELLILCAYGDALAVLAKLQKSLVGTHHLAINVSDARARIKVSGVDAREVLAKLTPADMATLQSGEIRRSRLAQVPAAFWMADDETIEVICFRSVAQYVFDLLKTAAVPGGEVGFIK